MRRTPGIATFFAAAVSGRLAARQQQVAELSQEFEGMAEYLYTGLSQPEQQVLERAALLPVLDSRVVSALHKGSGATQALPLADVLLDARGGRPEALTYPPVFRRFLLNRMTERLGPLGLGNMRREVAAIARNAGATLLAVQILLEGDLTPEAIELAGREVDALKNANRLDDARAIVRLLPTASLAEHPHLVDSPVRFGRLQPRQAGPRFAGCDSVGAASGCCLA